jgi:ubiquinone/menaquinone biosynthesis C-methylase UbiE
LAEGTGGEGTGGELAGRAGAGRESTGGDVAGREVAGRESNGREGTGAKSTGTEFTGERVVPGHVNDDLWSEHVARYAFARRYADGKRVLDAGCGAGYGSAELALSAANVTGVDVASDAIEICRASYPIPSLRFAVASCTAMPFPKNAFDLIVAFEVIEHLADYRAFLDECARVLSHQGLLIVSSPNKSYYAESRAKTGPNPFHEHEFEAEEFFAELKRVFSNVRLLLQNRVESFAFHPANAFWPAEARIDGGGGNAGDAHFLIGLCSFGPLPEPRSFVYVPKAANILREREQHLQLLENQLAEIVAERNTLLALYRKQKEELEERNRWAQKLGEELNAAGAQIVALQNEAETTSAGYQAKLTELEEINVAKTAWALDTETRYSAELQAKCDELVECVRLLERAEATVEERTLWAQRAESKRQELAAQLSMVRASRWIRLGRKFGVGPVIEQP